MSGDSSPYYTHDHSGSGVTPEFNSPPQKKCRCSLPDTSPNLVQTLGVPFTIEKFVVGTTTLEEKALPVHFWQSEQWHRAVRAGSPVILFRNACPVLRSQSSIPEYLKVTSPQAQLPVPGMLCCFNSDRCLLGLVCL